jgi:pterin-4a-carbinolamine dehydratase
LQQFYNSSEAAHQLSLLAKIMAASERISEDKMQNYLAKVPQWQRSGNAITRIYQFPNFLTAMGFTNSVAICAEAAQHHPDISVFKYGSEFSY